MNKPLVYSGVEGRTSTVGRSAFLACRRFDNRLRVAKQVLVVKMASKQAASSVLAAGAPARLRRRLTLLLPIPAEPPACR